MNEKQRIATRRYWADQARLERKSGETKARWDDPEERSKLMAGIGNPDSRNGIAAAMRARWTDPASRQEMTEQAKDACQDGFWDQGCVTS